ncbi:hypothetical protein B0H17DRAFT_1140388 [Mycena rosella]|uniref:Uncharacterized protein n=1 Tax=Mycena rosella TaxID=1033263 RepID=A0AAD7D1Z1_MYCRO|nr:hypothetical protein B0H17DRAFT_1140388 [Mycena rosella]
MEWGVAKEKFRIGESNPGLPRPRSYAPKPVTSPKPATAADFLRSKPVPCSTSATPVVNKTAEAAPVPAARTADKFARPIIKSASVPAVVPSSHARPTLSTTASLGVRRK